jgi:16S rRNA (guanine527-N7)-methyltransferase
MQVIRKYFPGLSSEQLEKFGELKNLYDFWNGQINLISRKDIENLYLHHVLHSLAIAKVMTFEASTKILDVGTGGGFPGIPLAILFSDVHFHLVDSIGKKIKVVEDIKTKLQLRNVTCEQIRAEQLNNRYDFVISRAVASLSEFVPWVQGKINKVSRHNIKNGILYLKGGNLEEDTKPFRKTATIINISDYFSEDYFSTKKIIYLPVR